MRALLVGSLAACRGASSEPTPPVPAEVAPPADPPHPAAPSAPELQRFRVEFTASPHKPPTERLLQRTATRFHGNGYEASLSLVAGAVYTGSTYDSVLVLRLEGQSVATPIAPMLVDAENLSTRLRFRELHGEQYLEVHVREDSSERRGYLTVLLYRVESGGSLVKVLEELVEVSQGDCDLIDRVQLTAAGARPDELRLVVRRERSPGRSRRPAGSTCAEQRPGVRSQSYLLRDNCFYPGRQPLYFAPRVERLGGAAPGCDSHECAPEPPRNEIAADLVRRAAGRTIDLTVPAWWVPVAPPHDPRPGASSWRAFELGPGCRVVLSGHRLGTPSDYVHSHNARELSALAREWIDDHCRPKESACTLPCRAENQLTPPICEHLRDRRSTDWFACGDLARARARDGRSVFDATALRVPQTDGSGAALLAVLSCERGLYDDAVTSLERALGGIAFEGSGRVPSGLIPRLLRPSSSQ